MSPAERVRVTVLADTHLPKRAKGLPAPVWAAVDGRLEDVELHRLPPRVS